MVRRQPEDFERIARTVRRKLGLEYQFRPDPITLVFKIKDAGWIKSYLRVPVAEMPDDEARYNQTCNRLEIREDTFCGANRQEPRAGMTIAHELGHVVFDHKGIRHRNTAGRAIEKLHLPTKLDEIEAKRFASTFLAPAYLVEDCENITEEILIERFNLSKTAAAIRLEQILELRRCRSGAERKLPVFVVDFLKDAQRRGSAIKTELD